MPQDVTADARQVLLSINDRVPWALEFEEVLINSPMAKKAFERLIAGGCDPGDLLFWLDFSCGGHATSYARWGETMALASVYVSYDTGAFLLQFRSPKLVRRLECIPFRAATEPRRP